MGCTTCNGQRTGEEIATLTLVTNIKRKKVLRVQSLVQMGSNPESDQNYVKYDQTYLDTPQWSDNAAGERILSPRPELKSVYSDIDITPSISEIMLKNKSAEARKLHHQKYKQPKSAIICHRRPSQNPQIRKYDK